MTTRVVVVLSAGCLSIPLSLGLQGAGTPRQNAASVPQTQTPGAIDQAPASRAILDKYCVGCHNERTHTAGMVLDKTVDVAHPEQRAEVWEKVIRKLRTGTMPPAGRPRPDAAGYDVVASWLETALDSAAARSPNPGRPALHRLNRVEYANAVRDLFGFDIDPTELLPPDNSGYGFDNIADVLSSSPALMERYMSASAKISQMALGHPSSSPVPATYAVRGDLDQDGGRVSEDLPFGSRGGIAVRYYFPDDGEYLIKFRLQENVQGQPRGLTGERFQLDVRLDGAKAKSFIVGGLKKQSDDEESGPPATPVAAGSREGALKRADDYLEFRTQVKAGSHLIGAYFVQPTSALVEDVIDPSMANYNIDTSGYPDFDRLSITGPLDLKQSDNSPSRNRILVCRPAKATDEPICARKIIATLARRAYRRPVTAADLEGPLDLYSEGARDGGFEAGIELAVRGILVDPQFLFRFEKQPAGAVPASLYRVSDLELASRLSFFLWSSIPDDELLTVAEKGKLRTPAVLEQQVRRMLADSRAHALTSNFAGQWLQTRNVTNLTPSTQLFVRFDDNLRQAFQRETELFFESIMREDRSVRDFLDADYTFVNERLARHYGIPDVYGDEFRRIQLPPDSVRRGLLGQGSILTGTSYGNRTSPVLRGKWILENVLGTPPPPPPPNVPALEAHDTDGKVLSMREQMAQHHANPVCASCHAQMEPFGLALENFDATGRWRNVDESGTVIDASAVLPSGDTFTGPRGLRQELQKKSDSFVTTFVQNLLTYALGRGLGYYDAPAVRHIKRDAADSNYRFASIVLGIVKSTPFQMSIAREGEIKAEVTRP
jgi:hypothetical protein